MNHIQTGGGAPDYVPPDDILDRVTSLLGSTANGFSVSFGGDSESEAFAVGVGNGNRSDEEVAVADAKLDNSLCLEGPATTVQDLVVETDCGVSNIQLMDLTPSQPQRFTFSTPKTGKKKMKQVGKKDESRIAKNVAIAEYFTAKKQCIDAKLNNILSENEKLKLDNEKLKLDNEKLKIELNNLKNQNIL